MKARRLTSLLFLFAAGVGVQACMSDNPPAYTGILGPERKPLGNTSSGGAGAGGSAGTSPGSGQSGTSGSAQSGTGGATAGEGGMGGEGQEGGDGGTGTGGKGSGGTSGAGGGAAGSGATAGIPEDNPPIDPNYSPACFMGPTQSGEEIKKGTPCTAEDPELCYRPCGPDQVGWKTETCLAGVYAEGDCTFPPEKDYSCYAIPDDIDEAACGLDAPPRATVECDAPLCMACNLDGFYEDSGTDLKEGFCVCRTPDRDGVRRWTCASDTSWPCPLNRGC
jgi:hypothetical protein